MDKDLVMPAEDPSKNNTDVSAQSGISADGDVSTQVEDSRTITPLHLP